MKDPIEFVMGELRRVGKVPKELEALGLDTGIAPRLRTDSNAQQRLNPLLGLQDKASWDELLRTKENGRPTRGFLHNSDFSRMERMLLDMTIAILRSARGSARTRFIRYALSSSLCRVVVQVVSGAERKIIRFGCLCLIPITRLMFKRCHCFNANCIRMFLSVSVGHVYERSIFEGQLRERQQDRSSYARFSALIEFCM